MPTPEEFLCGGRFCHPSRYRRKPSLSSLHQNHKISLLDQPDIIVELVDENGTPLQTNEARQIRLRISEGSGDFSAKEFTILQGQSEGRSTFLPASCAKVIVEARSDNLPDENLVLQVTWPTFLVIVTILGGALGGLLAFWKDQDARWWRYIVGGIVTGFIAYWAALLGIAPQLPVSRYILLNSFTALGVPILGGWLGTKVFSWILGTFNRNSPP
jgi:hypothetical protein